MIYKTLHRKPGVNLDAPEGLAVLAPLVTPVMLLSNDKYIMLYGNRYLSLQINWDQLLSVCSV